MRVCVYGAEGVGGGGGGYSKTKQYSRVAALITRSFNKCRLLLVCTETPGTMKMIGLELIGYGVFLVGRCCWHRTYLLRYVFGGGGGMLLWLRYVFGRGWGWGDVAGISVANIPPSTGHENNIAEPKPDKYLSSTSHCSPFNCCLSVVL